MSRGQWLAFGSTLAVVGCTEHFPAAPAVQQVGDATTPQADASDDPSALETGTWDQDVVPQTDSATGVAYEASAACWAGTFSCGFGGINDSNVCCDRATQYCYIAINGPGPSPPICVLHDAGIPKTPTVPQECVASFTCPCLEDAGIVNQNPNIGCQCEDLEAGAVRLSCIGCYGSPPARLERRWRSVS